MYGVWMLSGINSPTLFTSSTSAITVSAAIAINGLKFCIVPL